MVVSTEREGMENTGIFRFLPVANEMAAEFLSSPAVDLFSHMNSKFFARVLSHSKLISEI